MFENKIIIITFTLHYNSSIFIKLLSLQSIFKFFVLNFFLQNYDFLDGYNHTRNYHAQGETRTHDSESCTHATVLTNFYPPDHISQDTHINIGHLRDMGSSVCTALAALHDETQYMISLIKNSDNV